LVLAVVLSLVCVSFGKQEQPSVPDATTATLKGSASTLLPDGRILISGGRQTNGSVQNALNIPMAKRIAKIDQIGILEARGRTSIIASHE
jgi:hypothetical protein